MTIYRRPDPSLDAAVRRGAPGVRVAFRDARFTLVQLRELASRIMADRSYWDGRGVEIQSAAPMVDGSGVRVGTTQGTAQEAALLTQHYDVPGEITVEKISVVPDPGGANGFVPDVGRWPLPTPPAQ